MLVRYSDHPRHERLRHIIYRLVWYARRAQSIIVDIAYRDHNRTLESGGDSVSEAPTPSCLPVQTERLREIVHGHAVRMAKQTAGMYVLATIGMAVVLGLYGLFGTCACLVISTVSTVACRMVEFRRVTNFLKSNERNKSGGARPDGCMLCATHSDSYIWDLYVGDRGVIDGLLNKHMIAIDSPVSQWLVMWFQSADVLQLLAMTFAAARKGWDGVVLVIFMLFDWAVVFVTKFGNPVVHEFMRNNHLGVEVWTLDFPGHVAMLMAIHCCSQSNTWSWMDKIIVPQTRRDALLRQIERTARLAASVVRYKSWFGIQQPSMDTRRRKKNSGSFHIRRMIL